MPRFQVALIGLNSLFGRVSSMLLKQSPLIKCVKLYDVSSINAALDVSSINTQCRVKAFLGEEQLGNALLDTDIIVIGEESNQENATSDESYLRSLSLKYGNYAKAIANSSPNAIVVLATNPLNSSLPLFSQLLAKEGCYNCDKVLGATAVDTVRANAILARHLKLDPKDVVLPVIGGSSELTRVPIFSQSRPQFTLDQATKDKLTTSIKTGDRDTRQLKGSPETLNKCYSTMKFLNSIMRGLQGEKNVTDITLSKTDLVPGVEYFSLPVIFGKEGIAHRFGIPKVSDIEQSLVNTAIVNMKKEADRSALIIKGGDPDLNDCQFLSDEDKASKQKELFDLFVTTLNEVEEEFEITFKPNQRENLKTVFKNRQSLKISEKGKKAKNNKAKKNPLKALIPLRKDNKKKVSSNKIFEDIQKKLQPRLDCNSIVLCEPLACPERSEGGEQSADQVNKNIEEEPEKVTVPVTVPKEVVKDTKEIGVTTSLYTHNSNFSKLRPLKSKGQTKTQREKVDTQPDKKSENSGGQEKIEKVASSQSKRIHTIRKPISIPKNASPLTDTKYSRGKSSALRLKAADKIDKIGYYYKKLKQSDKKLDSTVQLNEVSTIDKVKKLTVYRYNANDANKPLTNRKSEIKPHKSGKTEHASNVTVETIKLQSTEQLKLNLSQNRRPNLRHRQNIQAYTRDHCAGTDVKNLSSEKLTLGMVEKTETKEAGKSRKTEEVKPQKENGDQEKRLVATKKTKIGENRETRHKLEKCDDPKEKNEQFQNEEEIVHLKHHDPGLFRPSKHDVLNPVSVTNYMQGKLHPEKNETVVTSRKYVLTGKLAKKHENEKSKMNYSQQDFISRPFPGNQKENETNIVENSPPNEQHKNSEGLTVKTQQEETSETKKDVQEVSSVIEKQDIKDDIHSKTQEKKSEELATASKEQTKNTIEAVNDQSEAPGSTEKSSKTLVQSLETEKTNKSLPSNKKSKPIRLHILKAFNEPVLQPAKTTPPKLTAKTKKASVFSYTNEDAKATPTKQSRSSLNDEKEKSSRPPTIQQNKVSVLGMRRLTNKETNSGICERISSQIKKGVELFPVEKISTRVGKKFMVPYYTMNISKKNEENKRTPVVENPRRVFSKNEHKKEKTTPLKLSDSPASSRSQSRKSFQNVRTGNSSGKKIQKKNVDMFSKPLRKIDTLNSNKTSSGANRRRRGCSLPQLRKSSGTKLTSTPKLKLTVKAPSEGIVSGIHYDSLSTIDFANYWKRREKEENCRRYPCPVPLIQACNPIDKPPLGECESKQAPADTNAEETPNASTTPEMLIYGNGGTCADFIRAKRLTKPVEGPWSTAAYWPTGETDILSRLSLNPVDKRFDEYSTCHIPSLKQTEEQYFLEERYE